MSDIEAIQQLLNTYTEAASRGDFDTVISTFTEDGIWEILAFNARFEGAANVKAAQMGFAEPMDYLVQINAPGVIKVDGDTATARSAIREGGKFRGKDESLEVLGHYADKIVRTQDGWKFAHRVFELQGMHRFPLLPAEG
jgi:ketosteroid isomerase-like protein